MTEQIEEKEITVGELRELWFSGEYDIELDTPDGYQPVTNWFDKGPLPIVEVRLDNGAVTRCAASHLVQALQDGEPIWKLASELDQGDQILTLDPHAPYGRVIEIIDQPTEDCYDFEIGHENHRY
jgi:hypothetical protein